MAKYNYDNEKLKSGIIYELPSGIIFNNTLLNNIIKRVPSWLTILLVLLFLFDSCKTFITKNKKQ